MIALNNAQIQMEGGRSGSIAVRGQSGGWTGVVQVCYSVCGTEMAGPLGSSKRSIVRSCMIMCRP